MENLLGDSVRRTLGRWRQGGERGQATVEVLLVLPLYVMLTAGVTYLGAAWYAKIAAEIAAYDGARTAVEAMGASFSHPASNTSATQARRIGTRRVIGMSPYRVFSSRYSVRTAAGPSSLGALPQPRSL